MNSNGGSLPGSFSDQPRANSNKFRGGYRRGRGRGNNERLGNHSQRDRKSQQSWREGGRPNMDETIDLCDSSQWPSIQEVSRHGEKGKPSNNMSSEKVAEQEINQDYADLYRESHAHADEVNENLSNRNTNASQRRNSNVSTGQYQNNNFSQNNNSYGNRQSSERYPNQTGTRGRGRYGNYSNNRYQTGYNRRYGKAFGTTGLPGGVVFPPEVSPFFCPQPFEPIPFVPDTPAVVKSELGPVKQVEYYFSEANLKRDTFIRKKMDEDGWVPLQEVYCFKRIKLMNISYDEFVKKLTSSELLDVDVGKNRIRTKDNPKQWVLKDGNIESEANVNSKNPNLFSSSGVQTAQAGFQMVPPYGYQIPLNYYPYGNVPSHFRHMQSYQMYPQPFFGIPFNEMPHEGAYNQYGQEYYGTYAPYQASNFTPTSSSDGSGQTGQSQSIQASELVSEQPITSSTATIATKEDEIEELTTKVSSIDVSNPPLSC